MLGSCRTEGSWVFIASEMGRHWKVLSRGLASEWDFCLKSHFGCYVNNKNGRKEIGCITERDGGGLTRLGWEQQRT